MKIPSALLFAVLLWVLSAETLLSARLNIEISYTESPSGLLITGTTNVPDGTKLGVSVEGAGYSAQDFDVYVKEGTFVSVPFTNRGQALAGNFKASIFIYPTTIWQKDPAVLSELLLFSGDLSKGKKVEKSIQLSLGNAAQKQESANQLAAESAEIESLAQRAIELLEKGKAMDPLRNINTAQQCGELMRKLQPQAKSLRSQIEQLPNSTDRFFLGAAGAGLGLCVSCSESLAMANCSDAESYLREGGFL